MIQVKYNYIAIFILKNEILFLGRKVKHYLIIAHICLFPLAFPSVNNVKRVLYSLNIKFNANLFSF